jgi:phosphotriesterase-related protein
MPRVRSVLGDIGPEELGRTLPHEHLLIDFVRSDDPPELTDAEPDAGVHAISLSNRHEATRRMELFPSNLQLLSVDDAIEELAAYKQAGGGSVVDATPSNLGRDPGGLARVSMVTGVHVIAGCGFYVHDYHPPEIAGLRAEGIRDLIVRELMEGDASTGIRAGIIGEIGLSWPVHPQEWKVLLGAVMAQSETGVALSVHPGAHPSAPLEILRAAERGGGDVQRIIMCHVDRTLFDVESILALSGAGCYVELDLFGRESSYYDTAYPDLPNDAGRIRVIGALIEAGALRQVLVSQDTWLKTDLQKYGGKGYGHLFRDAIPLMLRLGLSPPEIDQVTIHNPADALAFA